MRIKPERKEFPKSLKALAKELLMAQDRALHRELEEAEAEEIAAQQIERSRCRRR